MIKMEIISAQRKKIILDFYLENPYSNNGCIVKDNLEPSFATTKTSVFKA